MSLQIQEQNNAIIVPLEIKLDKLNELKEIVADLKRLSSELPEEVGGGAAAATGRGHRVGSGERVRGRSRSAPPGCGSS